MTKLRGANFKAALIYYKTNGKEAKVHANYPNLKKGIEELKLASQLPKLVQSKYSCYRIHCDDGLYLCITPSELLIQIHITLLY